MHKITVPEETFLSGTVSPVNQLCNRKSVVTDRHAFGKLLQKISRSKNLKSRYRFLRFRGNHSVARINTVKRNKGGFLLIRMHGFTKFLLITKYIQNVIPNLEGKAKTLSILGGGLQLLLIAVCRNDTQTACCRNQATGF